MARSILHFATIIVVVASSTSVMKGAELDPSGEQLERFTVKYDGDSRPDLITPHIKLDFVLGDAESMRIFERDLEPADLKKLNTFRQRLIEARIEDGKTDPQMFENLCRKIRGLSGEAIAKEVAKLDKTIAQRRNSLAQTLLASLSSDGSQKVWAQANVVAVRVKGSLTDVVGMSEQFPEYVKRQYTQRCIDFGYLEKD